MRRRRVLAARVPIPHHFSLMPYCMARGARKAERGKGGGAVSGRACSSHTKNTAFRPPCCSWPSWGTCYAWASMLIGLDPLRSRPVRHTTGGASCVRGAFFAALLLTGLLHAGGTRGNSCFSRAPHPPRGRRLTLDTHSSRLPCLPRAHHAPAGEASCAVAGSSAAASRTGRRLSLSAA